MCLYTLCTGNGLFSIFLRFFFHIYIKTRHIRDIQSPNDKVLCQVTTVRIMNHDRSILSCILRVSYNPFGSCLIRWFRATVSCNFPRKIVYFRLTHRARSLLIESFWKTGDEDLSERWHNVCTYFWAVVHENGDKRKRSLWEREMRICDLTFVWYLYSTRL